MNKKTLAILAIFMLVVAGVFWATRGKETEIPVTTSVPTSIPTSTNSAQIKTPPPQKQLITYTDSGFSPSTITINKDETVIFKSKSLKQMWVASDPHPFHSDYPEFDAKKGAGEGESYSFIFTKTGTWKYHNHLNPSDTSTIIVQ